VTVNVKTEKSWRGKRQRYWCHLVRLDSIFRKNPFINPHKKTFQPKDAFEDTAFKLGFHIVEF
jgi:hypothetical protein